MTNIDYTFNTDFSGVLGEDYDLLKHICPTAIEMSHLVGATLKGFQQSNTRSESPCLNIVELGCGTGITTLSLLSACKGIALTAIDNEPTMLNQAKHSLLDYVKSKQLSLVENDALSALSALPDNSVDVIASAYTLHNFLNDYRNEVIEQCYRVLAPGGLFINGDRYGLDDISAHTVLIQKEV
ncbi:MAG TPA: class I SAM-dependent methyltransferase, partial [Methylococcales bacterium]|nr:class I SAM-dependent methyltransferase [Methylococcales bacterium]